MSELMKYIAARIYFVTVVKWVTFNNIFEAYEVKLTIIIISAVNSLF